MHIEWIVSITIFMAAITFAFSYYTSFFDTSLEPSPDAYFLAILNGMKAEITEMPAVADSGGSGLLYAYLPFAPDPDSVRVFDSGGKSVSCMLSEGKVYWTASPSGGKYIISVASGTKGGCSSDLQAAGGAPATLLLQEKRAEFSKMKIDKLFSSDYQDLKRKLGALDFRIEISDGNESRAYGPPLPANRDVFSREFKGNLYETGEQVTARIMVW